MSDEVADRHAFGDPAAALDAFEHLPFVVAVTDGPELRLVAYNEAARVMGGDRFRYGATLTELFSVEVMGQGWVEMYTKPTLSGEVMTADEHRIQFHQPGGDVQELYIDAAFVPRPSVDGTPRGTIAFTRDVTAKVLARQAMERELVELRDRYAESVGATRAMQRALLPAGVPVLPDVDVVARYLLAGDEQAAGGDWFDVVAREDGTVVLVVGDVVGHGPTASVAMGQLRSVLLAHLRAGHDIVSSLEFLDGFARTVEGAARATVCIVVVDPRDGEVSYCTAGHPPPLIVSDDDEPTRFLVPTGSGPLVTNTTFITARAPLRDGESIVVYTDGILERPAVPIGAAMVELRNTAANAHRNQLMPAGASTSTAQRICELTIELLTRATGHRDDITLLVLHRRQPVEPLALTLDAGRHAITEARESLCGWLESIDAQPKDVQRLAHAATELVSNVIDHAYLESPALPFQLRAHLDRRGTAVITIADQGSWKVPVIALDRGRGLALTHELVDHLDLRPSSTGTTACIRHSLQRPARMHATPTAGVATPAEHFDVWSTGGPDPVVHVTGPFDATTTPEVQAHLALALGEASETLTIDLTDVSLLASAGIDLLHVIREHASATQKGVAVKAPAGTTAHQILTLTDYPSNDEPTQ